MESGGKIVSIDNRGDLYYIVNGQRSDEEVSDADKTAVENGPHGDHLDVIEESVAEKQGRWTVGDQWAAAAKQGWMAVVNKFFSGYEEYRGLGGLGSLFLGKEALAKRRQDVNDAFCSTVILGGSGCWASKLCEMYSDEPGGKGVIIADTQGGPFSVIAHVEGER